MYNNILGNLIITDIKRLKNYILEIFIAVFLILFVCICTGSVIASKLYEEKSFDSFKIGYYLPDDEDLKYNLFAIRMLNDMESMQETAELLEVESIDKGYELLENGDILYLIVVPENFFSGILDSTNTPLDIVVYDNSSISSYIANELFMSYAKYLGIAQAAIYSTLDTLRSNEIPSDEISVIQDRVNLTYLDRALNKDSSINTVTATTEGNFSLKEHYMAVAVLLSICFCSFVLTPYLNGYNPGVIKQLQCKGVKSYSIFTSKFISTFIAVYFSFLLCFFAVSILNKKINISGLIAVIPTIFVVALFIVFISTICKNVFNSNMIILVITLIIIYIGGGILPSALLPGAVQNLSNLLPGSFLITNVANSLFGI